MRKIIVLILIALTVIPFVSASETPDWYKERALGAFLLFETVYEYVSDSGYDFSNEEIIMIISDMDLEWVLTAAQRLDSNDVSLLLTAYDNMLSKIRIQAEML